MQRFKMTMKVGSKTFLTQEVSYPDDANRLDIAISLLAVEQKLIKEHVKIELEELDGEG